MSNSDFAAQEVSKKDDTDICLQRDCTSLQQARGLCSKHGGRPVCNVRIAQKHQNQKVCVIVMDPDAVRLLTVKIPLEHSDYVLRMAPFVQ